MQKQKNRKKTRVWETINLFIDAEGIQSLIQTLKGASKRMDISLS